LLVGLCALPAIAAFDDGFKAQEGPVNIQADRLIYEEENDTYEAEGDVLITFSGGSLSADRVILRKPINTAYAKGKAVLKSDKDVLEGDSIIFNIDTKTGTVDGGKMFAAQNHVYIKGRELEKVGEASYRIQDAVATTCDGPNPAWQLKSREMNVTIDGYGTLKHGTFYAREMPILYLPYMIFPVKTTRQSGFLLPYLSYSKDKNGADVELPFYWAIAENMDATFYQRFMSKRGYKQGAEFRYALSPESSGVIYGDYLYQDRLRIEESNSVLSRDWEDNHDRWSYFWQHESVFDNGYYLRADIARVSDHWYFKDFSNRNYYKDHYARESESPFNRVLFDGSQSVPFLDSKVRFAKDWSLFNLTALARYTDDFSRDSNANTLQQYPEVTLTAINQPLPYAPLRFDMTTSYNNYYRSEGQKGSLYDMRPALSLPFSLGPYAQVLPRFEWDGALWSAQGDEVPGIDQNGNRSSYVAGSMVTSEVQRIYHVNGKNVQKIRHGIRTEIGYAYSPHVDQTDSPDFVEQLNKQNAVSYALINTLMLKMNGGQSGPRYWELMRLKLAQTYDFEGVTQSWEDELNPKERHFGMLEMELDLKPLPNLSFKNRSYYDVNDGSWMRTNSDLSISMTEKLKASVGYHYTQKLLEEINLSLMAKINKNIDVEMSLNHNRMTGETVEQTYTVNYHRQCWGVKVGVSESSDDRQISAILYLIGLGI
jgi:LPS-assembly protein